MFTDLCTHPAAIRSAGHVVRDSGHSSECPAGPATPRCRVGGRAGRRLPGRPTFRSWPPSSEFSGGRSAHTWLVTREGQMGSVVMNGGHSGVLGHGGHRGLEPCDISAAWTTLRTATVLRAESSHRPESASRGVASWPSSTTDRPSATHGIAAPDFPLPLSDCRFPVAASRLPRLDCRVSTAASRLPRLDCRVSTAASRARPPSGCVQHRHL